MVILLLMKIVMMNFLSLKIICQKEKKENYKRKKCESKVHPKVHHPAIPSTLHNTILSKAS